MEFTGRVKKILPLRSGVSQRTGNEWKSLPFIFEFFEHDTDHFPQTVVLESFNTNVIDNLKENMEVCCGFEHRTREYEGKFYNEMRLYKIESIKAANQAPQGANAPAAGNIQGHVGQELQKKTTDTLQVNQQEDPNDDLPF